MPHEVSLHSFILGWLCLANNGVNVINGTFCNNPLLKFFYIRTSRSKDKTKMIPEIFVTLIKNTLSKMAFNKCLPPEHANMDFWQKWSNKLRAVRYSELKLRVTFIFRQMYYYDISFKIASYSFLERKRRKGGKIGRIQEGRTSFLET